MRTRPSLRACAAVASIAALVSCGDLPPDGRESDHDTAKPSVWTLFDVADAHREGRAVARSKSFPAGFDARALLVEQDGVLVPRVTPAFSEGDAAAYVTTDFWVGFEEIWAQPWYVLVSAWDDKSPQTNRLREADGMTPAAPVYDVGPKSAFWSPFWQVFYAVVPPGRTAADYRSAESIFDDRLPLHVGTPWFYTARPPWVTLGAPGTMIHPYVGTEVGLISAPASSWVDGQELPYISIGGNNFRYDDELVVEELPLFILSRRSPNGDVMPIGAPNVGASAPLYSRRAAEVVAGRPRFGSLWRLYFAIVPATAAAFDQAEWPTAVAALTTQKLNPKAYQGRVATNAIPASATGTSCFAAPTFPASCTWLDSGARIEDQLGRANLERTDVMIAAPLVFFAGKGIGR